MTEGGHIAGNIVVRALSRSEQAARVADLAALRIAVFRDWPYLYDGDAAYEQRYLERFIAAPDAVVIAALDGERMVGAATASPLSAHHSEFAEPFAAAGLDVSEWFYLAESVLLPEARGLGIGHAFFDLREDAGRAQGFAKACFCAVVRPDGHPRRQPGARSLEPFWRKRGYRPQPGLVAQFSWKDIGDDDETGKPMQFWLAGL